MISKIFIVTIKMSGEPLCTIVNGSASYFFSVYLRHTSNFIFTGPQRMDIMKAFVSIKFDTDAIYITDCSTIEDLKDTLRSTILKLHAKRPFQHTTIYCHWPDFFQLNYAMKEVAMESSHLIHCKFMEEKMASVAYNCLSPETVSAAGLKAMFMCYSSKHLGV